MLFIPADAKPSSAARRRASRTWASGGRPWPSGPDGSGNDTPIRMRVLRSVAPSSNLRPMLRSAELCWTDPPGSVLPRNAPPSPPPRAGVVGDQLPVPLDTAPAAQLVHEVEHGGGHG